MSVLFFFEPNAEISQLIDVTGPRDKRKMSLGRWRSLPTLRRLLPFWRVVGVLRFRFSVHAVWWRLLAGTVACWLFGACVPDPAPATDASDGEMDGQDQDVAGDDALSDIAFADLKAKDGAADAKDVAAPADSTPPPDTHQPTDVPKQPTCVVSAEICNDIDDDCDGQTDEGACDDGNVCTEDLCNGWSNICSFNDLTIACSDGNACTTGEKCKSGACFGGLNKVCIAPCQTACVAQTGECGATPDGLKCGGKCLTDAVCLAGQCAGTVDEKICDDKKECTEDYCCIPGSKMPIWGCGGMPPGTCMNAPMPQGSNCGKADDSKYCFVKLCSASGGCGMYTIHDAPCDDGSPCTVGDYCEGSFGVCTGKSTCDDGNPCTFDNCDKTPDKCVYVNVVDGANCGDKKTCQSGKCVAAP